MKPWIWGVGVLFSFGAGIALGMLMIPGDDKRPNPILAQVDDDPPATNPQPEQPRETPRDTRPDPAPQAERPQPVFNDPPSSADPLMAALQGIDLAPTAAGSGVITGKVETAEGEPIAGVTIQLTPPTTQRYVNPWSRGDEPDPWEKLASDVRDFVRYRLALRPPQFRTVTDAAGAFSIGGLADEKYRVYAMLDGYAFTYVDGYRHEPGADVSILARPVLRVKIRVKLVPGIEIDNCSVTHRDLGSSNWDRDLPRPEDGVWVAELQPGMHVFTARINDPRTPGEPVLLHLKPDMEPQELTLELGEVSSITGTVETGGGEAASTMYVVCVPIEAGKDYAAELKTARSSRNRRSVNSEGKYTFPVMTPGSYAMAVNFGGEIFDIQQIEHSGGTTTVNFSAQGPDTSECIICTVQPHAGQALSSPRFTLRDANGAHRGTLSAWKSGPNEFRLKPPAKDPQLPVELEVSDGNNGSGYVTLHTLAPQRVSVELGPRAVLVLRFPGWESPNRNQLYARLYDTEGRSVVRRSLRNWVGDMLSVGSVPPGVLKLELTVGSGSSAVPLITQQITVDEQGSIIVLHPPELYSVTLKLPDGERTQVTIEGEIDGKTFRRRVYYNNRATTVSGLPAGRYTAKWRPRGSREEKSQYFNLPGAETLDLTS